MIPKYSGWFLVTLSMVSWIAGLFVVMVLGLSTMYRPAPMWIEFSYLASTTTAGVIGCWAFLECPKGSVLPKFIAACSALVAVFLALMAWAIVFI
jgi:hypothetical protein